MNIFINLYIIVALVSFLIFVATIFSSFSIINKLTKIKSTLPEIIASWMLYLVYLSFGIDFYISLSAVGGTFGDGATSTHRYVNPDILGIYSVIQLTVFVWWTFTRLINLKNTKNTWMLFMPSIIPFVYVVKYVTLFYMMNMN